MKPLSLHFIKTVSGTFENGDAWLESLPQQIAECEKRWGLRVGEPFVLSYNFVAEAWRENGETVVLKLGVPRDELTREIAAVDFCAGVGMARLLDADVEAGALLLERLLPGQMLSDVENDEVATRIGAEVMGRLFHPISAETPFKPVEKWADGLLRVEVADPFPQGLVGQARNIFAELFASQGERVLIHGDLHHFNVLSAENDWLAIDPKGMSGERAYEPGAFLRNPMNRIMIADNPAQLLDRRIHIFAEMLDLDYQRIAAYAFAQSVLSAWWLYEDLGSVNETEIELCRYFQQLL